MPIHISNLNITERSLARFAENLAFMLAPGDVVLLDGDLGAGKTTFARALIRSLMGGSQVEVPSPTFTLVQNYITPRFPVAHFDLYRLNAPEELDELGLDAALKSGVAIIEWPERARDRLPADVFTIQLSEGKSDETRALHFGAEGASLKKAERLGDILYLLAESGWAATDTHLSYLQGDASPRRYARLIKDNGDRAILMDSQRQPDGPPIRDGKPYSRIAHLAEDVRPFVAIANGLRTAGFSAPEIFADDFERGLLIIEDFGDAVFGAELSRSADQRALWQRGVTTLAALRNANPPTTLPLPDLSTYELPPFDLTAFLIETELLVDWYWPALYGATIPAEARADFIDIWSTIASRVLSAPQGWMLRDYHSPNLIALPDRAPPRDTGIIDFQDALAGPWAYDLVSLLQDARLDVAADLENELYDLYVRKVRDAEPKFDEGTFRLAYAALGAQRNTKILGIFARLAKRDGKRQYLAHIPRIWGYLERSLAHPELQGLKAWYDRHLPPDSRRRPLNV